MAEADVDVVISGAGLVGRAIATGLTWAGCRVPLQDAGEGTLHASGGDLDLAGVQGKGAGASSCAVWTQCSTDRFRRAA